MLHFGICLSLQEAQLALPLGQTDGSKDRGEERPRKRRKLHEVAVFKMRDCQLIPTKLRTPNARARTKMKAQRLILEDGSSTESSVAASQGRLTSAEWLELEVEAAAIKEDGPWKKGLLPSYKLEKNVGPSNVGSYVELVCNRTRVKVATANATVKKVKSLTAERATAKILLEEKKKQLQESEQSMRLEASRVAFNKELRRVDELIARLEKKDQAHAVELAAKVKALVMTNKYQNGA
ncbi:hypothetical protein AXG93_557s1060 [Marchantia polymorpha subsp. ruderalis]|uniref:Uncharacterized protein n=1 Tax=Marchantia polymorpha subsp. ruderalis TaxID=1480154 RepID=A0A176VQI4_MARPO|nr:hypothetical protein AXG93_557s1060 [Marchantia polymorpha subsp. ruderalis]